MSKAAGAQSACASIGGFARGSVLPFLEVTNLLLPALLVAVFWGVAVVNVLTAHSLSAFGIQPRTMLGLLGVLLAPFIHLSFGHVLANTVPFFALSAVLQKTRGTMHYLLLSAVFALLGGLMVWGFARGNTSHAGASGLIFSYMGFFLLAGVLHRNWLNLLVAVVVTLFYGSMLFGMFPTNEEVSWEGHLFGFLVGGVGGYGYFMMGGSEEMERVVERTVGSEEERAPILA